MRPRALMLSPELPYPLQGGGALRTASLLNYLAQSHQVDLILFRHLDSQEPLTSLPPGLVNRVLVLELPRHSRNTIARCVRNTRRLLQARPPLLDRFQGFDQPIRKFLHGHRYREAVIEHFWCAPYHATLAPFSSRIVLDLHNIESQLHCTEARAAETLAERFAHQRFATLYRTLERTWVPRFSEILTASVQDSHRVCKLNSNITVFPNSVPFRGVPDVMEEDVIAFSGNFDYHPNQNAVAWFARHVWPGIAAAHPSLKWRLIGMNPESVLPLVRHLPRVEWTGGVADAVEELARARVVVVPLLSGSGTRLKIIEAWAAARPVLSTPIGAEGLQTDNLSLAPPAEFATALERLLNDGQLRNVLASRGRACFEQHHTWQSAWTCLEGHQQGWLTPVQH